VRVYAIGLTDACTECLSGRRFRILFVSICVSTGCVSPVDLSLRCRLLTLFQVFGEVQCLYALKQSDRDICTVTCLQTSHYYATRPKDSAQIKGLVRPLAFADWFLERSSDRWLSYLQLTRPTKSWC
jgi:hypothetical protein